MRSGEPLDDDDRLPWLLAVARWIEGQLAAYQTGIITCSDLKRAYHDITIGQRGGVTLVCLKGEEAVIHQRLLHRQHRYMPLSLLASQFEALEEPVEDEHAITLSCTPRSPTHCSNSCAKWRGAGVHGRRAVSPNR
jgi:gluconokinase